MALFVLLFSGLGIVTALKLPETYSTSARLLFEAPQIPDSMVRSTVQTGAVEQLDIIEQRLLTRANLIDIANRFNVFENIRGMEPDKVVEAMRKATDVQRTTGGRNGDRATLMTISFKSRSPRIAANVVNEYVTLVLEENSRFRVSRAENTLEFFEQEVARLAGDLDRQSVEIARFKSENANALPQDQAYRLGRQTLLQERLAGLERDLKAGQQQREDIIRAFEATGRITQAPAGTRRSQYEEQLIVSRAELENLREDYSDDNPRIIRLKNRIDRLEAIVAARTSAGSPDVEAEDVSPEQALLDATLTEIDSGLETIQSEIDRTKAELEELQTRIAQSAANGIQLAELERDYDVIQTRYNAAISNLNTAQMSERIEATAQGQRITVLENANVPTVPSGPDRPKIAALGIVAGIGLAAGYLMLLESLNRAIRRPDELAERFDVTPIATIPYMESRQARFLRRTGLLTATLAVLVSVPAALWYIDTHYLPLELIVQKGLDKFGLG
ncbi:MAG: GumC family protein [Rhodovulum sp.]